MLDGEPDGARLVELGGPVPVREVVGDAEVGRHAAVELAVAVVGIEFGFLLVYRSGWNLGIAAVVTNVVASLLLIPVAIFLFKDKISLVNIAGILVCLAGLVMLNWKR